MSEIVPRLAGTQYQQLFHTLVQYKLLAVGNPVAKALSSGMEVATTLTHPAEEQCRLAIRAQEEDKQVKRGPNCMLQTAWRFRVGGGGYLLLKTDWQANGAMLTSPIARLS